ncbi:hypothetical protein NW768_005231, partial [Fusarium equiseti]
LKLEGGVVSCKSVQEKECISAGGYVKPKTENRQFFLDTASPSGALLSALAGSNDIVLGF